MFLWEYLSFATCSRKSQDDIFQQLCLVLNPMLQASLCIKYLALNTSGGFLLHTKNTNADISFLSLLTCFLALSKPSFKRAPCNEMVRRLWTV